MLIHRNSATLNQITLLVFMKSKRSVTEPRQARQFHTYCLYPSPHVLHQKLDIESDESNV